jgi:hypothetical protein
MESVLGFLIALAVGLTGIGGGTLGVPLLVLVLGRSPVEAVGVCLLFVTITKLAAVPIYWWRGQVHQPTLRRLLAGGLPGVAIGWLVLRLLDTRAWQPLLFALVGATVASSALWHLLRRPQARAAKPGRLALLAAPIGVEVGFSSAGAGALGSILLLSATTLAPAEIVGTNLAFGLALSAFGGGLHVFTSAPDLLLLGKLLAGGMAGSFAGAWLAPQMPAAQLRHVLNFLLLFLGAQLAWKGISGF